ncbi:T-complex protein 11-domain-containing protein [Gilbertella persicaria]|uniref:Uncharacterized protein n=1 Tax=Rhizopus stolonifer TaxID=4846 RepID=A0A367JQS9_RHIST|nr:T-complex protein 11-domain-containing protein [Gilbertella persicaria]KAI8056517.1 T-complex protein 11-domain-containing protein [Gilbertella persicaria]RCH92288.1 hypothetical protein CU098_005992 [Rhizopus stolonifer]
MLNNDSVQTHNSSNQESSSDPVLMPQLASNQPSSNNEEFDFPQSPKPTIVLVSKKNVKHASYHATTTHLIKRRLKKAFSSVSILSPPQNRLAFINAVKTAWLLQIKKKKKTQYAPKKHYKLHRKRSASTTSQETVSSQGSKNGDIGISKNKFDFPPITAEALSELSIPHLFQSLQIRHDLLIDPHLTFRPNLTLEKAQESQHYWRRLDQLIQLCSCKNFVDENNDNHYQLIILVRNLLSELSLILVSLISPFPTHITTSFVWNWPSYITENSIIAVFDPDVVQQQLMQGCLNIHFKFDFLHSILSPLCPEQAEKIQKLVERDEYAKALESCFLTLETIKLDCANKALHYYRSNLLETGTSIEWNVFLKQLDNGEINISSVSDWMTCSWNRLGSSAKFIHFFRSGIIDLVTDDNDTIKALQLSTCSFPITFSYDEKRLKHQMRHEFQNIIVIGLLLMPYRLMAGKKAKQTELYQLKSTYSKLLKDASITSGRVSCFHLALHACNMVKQQQNQPMKHNDVIEQARYWSNWMNQNLRNTSPVYQVMYYRVRSIILHAMTQGSFVEQDIQQQHATIGLEQEIGKLSEKLSLIADYNLRTFGSLYTYLLPSIRHKVI